jgi:hypothetical protein
MNTFSKIFFTGLSVVVISVVSAESVSAFAPFNWIKEKLTPQQQQIRQTYQNERIQEMAQFFGMSAEDLQKELDSGKKPWQIAQEHNIDINTWRQSRMDEMKEHKKGLGWSEEQINQWMEQKQNHWQNNTNGGCNGQGFGGGMGMGLGRGKRQ